MHQARTVEKLSWARSGRSAWIVASALVGVALVGGCRQIEEVRDNFRDMTAHEAYERSLSDAGLAGTALGRDWVDAARRALTEPVPVSLPYREEGFLPKEDAGAMGFRLDLERGQRLSVDLEVRGERPARVFIDLYRAASRPDEAPLYVMSTDTVEGGLAFNVRRGGTFIVRLQPELLRGGEYRLTIRSGASLAFPVSGAGAGQIQSYFGADRDGGRRSHHGVDIFMPRGTPVVAGAPGRVTRVQVTPRGGKVIWLRDGKENQSLYYAHLDSQIVRDGALVRAGEVLGLVGNSGNARTTPPHLHFGIYRRGEGPVNPYPYVFEPTRTMPEVTGDAALVGGWVRATVDAARLRGDPSSSGEVLAELALNTPVRVRALSGGYYRAELPDGRRGFVASRVTEAADQPIRTEVAGGSLPVRIAPDDGAPVVERPGAGVEIPVFGTFGDFLYVRGATGRNGWIRASSRTADADQP